MFFLINLILICPVAFRSKEECYENNKHQKQNKTHP